MYIAPEKNNSDIPVDRNRYIRMGRVQPEDYLGDWTKTNRAIGATEGGFFDDPSGQKWYVKVYRDEDQTRNDFLVTNLYKTFDVPVPDVKLVYNDHFSFDNEKTGIIGIASKIIPDATPMKHSERHLFHKDAVTDSLLDLRDAHEHNVLTSTQRDAAYRIDVGGSVLFHELGGRRFYGENIPELTWHEGEGDYFRYATHRGDVYIMEEDFYDNLLKIEKLGDKEFKDIIDEYGYEDEFLRNLALEKLILRKKYLQKIADKPSQEELEDYIEKTKIRPPDGFTVPFGNERKLTYVKFKDSWEEPYTTSSGGTTAYLMPYEMGLINLYNNDQTITNPETIKILKSLGVKPKTSQSVKMKHNKKAKPAPVLPKFSGRNQRSKRPIWFKPPKIR